MNGNFFLQKCHSLYVFVSHFYQNYSHFQHKCKILHPLMDNPNLPMNKHKNLTIKAIKMYIRKYYRVIAVNHIGRQGQLGL